MIRLFLSGTLAASSLRKYNPAFSEQNFLACDPLMLIEQVPHILSASSVQTAMLVKAEGWLLAA